MARRFVATSLLALGRRCSARHIVLLDAIVGYVALGRWLERYGITRVQRANSRQDLFRLALPSLRGHRPLYIELGVHQGHTIRWWATHLEDDDARLHGFDSFLGLPETWNEENTAGRFSTDGSVPANDDPRICFFPGWFADTLSSYDPPAHDSVFLNFDADLYSSTATALNHLRPVICPGAWLYFDELNDKNHELRALDEFLQEAKIELSAVARAANGRHWLFRVKGI